MPLREKNKNKEIELLTAIKSHEHSLLNALLLAGVRPDSKNINGVPAISVAILNRNWKALEKLLSFGANPNEIGPSRATPLFYFQDSSQDAKNSISLLVEHGASLNHQNYEGLGLVGSKIFAGKTRLASHFISIGAPIGQKDTQGATPLHRAAGAMPWIDRRRSNPNEQLIRKMLALNSDVNEKDVFGDTPINYSIDSNTLGCFKILVKNGADLLIRNSQNNTSFHLIVSRGQMLGRHFPLEGVFPIITESRWRMLKFAFSFYSQRKISLDIIKDMFMIAARFSDKKSLEILNHEFPGLNNEMKNEFVFKNKLRKEILVTKNFGCIDSMFLFSDENPIRSKNQNQAPPHVPPAP